MNESKQIDNEPKEQPYGFWHSNPASGWFLILIAGIFILSNADVEIFGSSPWILMAVLPVYWIGIISYRMYREDGYLSRRVLLTLSFSLLPFIFVGASMLGIDIGAIWPIVLIIVGLSYILNGSRY